MLQDKFAYHLKEKLDCAVSIDEEAVPPPYDDNKKNLIANHPLTWLIDHNRQELIAHPLIVSLYNRKWNTLGWYVYYRKVL